MRRPTRSTRPTPASGSSATPTGSATAATSDRASRSSPTARATTPPRRRSATLPGNIYIGAPLSGTNVLYRVNAGGAAIAVDRQRARLAGRQRARRAPTTTPAARSATRARSLPPTWSTSRPARRWASGPRSATTRRRHRDAVDLPGRGRHQHRGAALLRQPLELDPTVQRHTSTASTKLTNYDPNVDPGVNKGTMKSFDITSDGIVNIDFTPRHRQPRDQRDRDPQQRRSGRTPTLPTS